MIQFNLLPDVKLDYIKAQRTKHAVTVISGLVAASALGVLVLLFVAVNVLQKQHINRVSKDITKESKQLKSIPDIDKILTVQNQLRSLSDLHKKRPMSSRTFDYLTQIAPPNVGITKLNLDFDNSTMKISGTADSLTTVNKLADSLKFTTFQAGKDGEQKKAFSSVVLTNFDRNNLEAIYIIDLKFDSLIYSSADDVTLSVPNIISTRSETEKPGAIFQQAAPSTDTTKTTTGQ